MYYTGLANFSKYFLIIANVILASAGGFLLVAGLLSLMQANHSSIIYGSIIVGGIITIIVCLFGCKGARKENPKSLRIYGGIMLLILGVELLSIVIFGRVGFPKESDIKEVFDHYGQDATNTNFVDTVQQKLFCCGFSGPNSMKRGDGTYPSSCCAVRYGECRHPFSDGCSLQLTKVVSNTFFAVKIVISVIVAISWILYILLVITAFYFASVIEKKRYAQQLESLHKYGHI